MDTIQQIKNQIPILDLLIEYGFDVSLITDKTEIASFPCCFHGETHKQSLLVFFKNNTFKCKECGKNGDVINLYALLNKTSVGSAIRTLGKHLKTTSPSGKLNSIKEFVQKTSLDNSHVYSCLQSMGQIPNSNVKLFLPETFKAFGVFCIEETKHAEVKKHMLEKFPLETLVEAGLFTEAKKFKIKKNSPIVPLIQNGRVVSLLQSKELTAPLHGFLFNSDILHTSKNEPVYLCENVKDTMLLSQNGKQAVGIINLDMYTNEVIEHLKDVETLRIVFSNTKHGNTVAQHVYRHFKRFTGRESEREIFPKGVHNVYQLYLSRKKSS